VTKETQTEVSTLRLWFTYVYSVIIFVCLAHNVSLSLRRYVRVYSIAVNAWLYVL